MVPTVHAGRLAPRPKRRREHVASIVIACALADVLLMSAGVAGLGAVLGRLPRLTWVLTLAGALFLACYGLGALRRAIRVPAGLTGGAPGEALSRRGALLRAAGFTLLNPHVYLDTVLLVGAVGAAQPPGGRFAFVAGAGAASALWFASLGYGARLLAPVFRRPGSWRVLDGLVGATMLMLAAELVARHDG